MRTLEWSKAAVKARYPKAVCCSIWDGENEAGFNGHWHLIIRSQRNGQALSSPVSVNVKGANAQAWREAADRLSAL